MIATNFKRTTCSSTSSHLAANKQVHETLFNSSKYIRLIVDHFRSLAPRFPRCKTSQLRAGSPDLAFETDLCACMYFYFKYTASDGHSCLFLFLFRFILTVVYFLSYDAFIIW